MASIGRGDTDQAEPRIDTGNVFAGANAPLKITAILYGTHLSPVTAGGADVAGAHGVLHIQQNGIYRYVRYARPTNGEAPQAKAPGVKDRFRYQVVDGNGMATVANLDFPTVPAPSEEQEASTALDLSTAIQAIEIEGAKLSMAERLVAKLALAELAAAEQADGVESFVWA